MSSPIYTFESVNIGKVFWKDSLGAFGSLKIFDDKIIFDGNTSDFLMRKQPKTITVSRDNITSVAFSHTSICFKQTNGSKLTFIVGKLYGPSGLPIFRILVLRGLASDVARTVVFAEAEKYLLDCRQQLLANPSWKTIISTTKLTGVSPKKMMITLILFIVVIYIVVEVILVNTIKADNKIKVPTINVQEYTVPQPNPSPSGQ